MLDFNRIIGIREKRLDDLRRRETAALAACENRRADIMQAQEDIDDFRDASKNLELNLLQELMETQITMDDLGALEEKLAEAEATAQALVEALAAAKESLTEAEAAVDQARAVKTEAQSKLNRIGEMNKVQIAEQREAEIAKEDAEIDAFVETMFGSKGSH